LGGDTIHHDALLLQLQASVAVKQRIVAADPFEEGLRKVLNLGHTVGHALESFAHAKGEPLLHGHAVAWGLVAELVLSHMALQFASTTLHRVAHFVSAHYPPFFFTCDDYPTLLALMQRDKKSRDGEINCTLLQAVGTPMVNQSITHQDMSAALDITRDFMGI
ncbi:MAG: 3-dehydroquinate synthase, partial [Muribaculaceae bacterium]|nr:3-dehydroquinate synthase [Muribaculaceae bacterium]